MMNRADQKVYQEWLDLCERIKSQTGAIPNETPTQKDARKKSLLDSFPRFAAYYFPHLMDSDFGWFHLEAAKKIANDQNIFLINEWPREHAKSVFGIVMVPMWLYARGELQGMVVASANEDKAKTLLSDLQAQFTSNMLWINDYGQLAAIGDWTQGQFTTTDGMGFWAFGRGQSPRGIRKGAKRPNLAVIDDIDDKVLCRNEERVKEVVNWVLEDLYGALSILGARLIVSGNRIHAKSVLAHLVGDTEPDQPKRQGITHIKVYALEAGRTHQIADETTGVPAWKERYTIAVLKAKMEKMGHRAAQREFFHQHMEDGNVFKPEWIHWNTAHTDPDGTIVYCDPSFKDTKKSDYKAVVVSQKKGLKIHIRYAWIKKASIKSMVHVFFDLFDQLGDTAQYYMEANFLQDLIIDEFYEEAERRDYAVPIRPDRRGKPQKEFRIENLTPLFERGLVTFEETERKSPDMQTLVNQFLAFPTGHDDGPDAVEGGVYLLQQHYRTSQFNPRGGGYAKNTDR